MVSIFAFLKNDQKNGINIYTAVGNNILLYNNNASFENVC